MEWGKGFNLSYFFCMLKFNCLLKKNYFSLCVGNWLKITVLSLAFDGSKPPTESVPTLKPDTKALWSTTSGIHHNSLEPSIIFHSFLSSTLYNELNYLIFSLSCTRQYKLVTDFRVLFSLDIPRYLNFTLSWNPASVRLILEVFTRCGLFSFLRPWLSFPPSLWMCGTFYCAL